MTTIPETKPIGEAYTFKPIVSDPDSLSGIQLLEEMWGEAYAKFDWWQATISLEGWSSWDKELGEEVGAEHNFIRWLKEQIAFCDVTQGGGSNSYERRATFRRGDSVICTVQWGGVNPDPNITATGDNAPMVRAIIMAKFPTGRISRVDSAFDSMSGTENFLWATAWAEDRAKRAGINTTWIRNSDPSKGDTLYIGSKSSRVQIRIYEKGKQMGYKAGEWWRAEVQLRPDTKGKERAYHESAGALWAASRVTRDLWAFLGGEKLVASGFQEKNEVKDLDTRAAHLVKQYGNLLKELLEEKANGSAVELVHYLDTISEQTTGKRIAPTEPGERG